MTIQFNDREITLKYSFRGYIIYENIMGESFKSNGMKEVVVLFYSMAVASNPEIVNDFDSFIEWLDNNPEKLNEFSQWIVDNLKRNDEVRDTNIESHTNKDAEEIDSKN